MGWGQSDPEKAGLMDQDHQAGIVLFWIESPFSVRVSTSLDMNGI
jgi:hypothetical protein